jgi:hypothetical protein
MWKETLTLLSKSLRLRYKLSGVAPIFVGAVIVQKRLATGVAARHSLHAWFLAKQVLYSRLPCNGNL